VKALNLLGRTPLDLATGTSPTISSTSSYHQRYVTVTNCSVAQGY